MRPRAVPAVPVGVLEVDDGGNHAEEVRVGPVIRDVGVAVSEARERDSSGVCR